MFSKIEVNGEGAAPLYRHLTAAIPSEDGTNDIAWNFTKFLIGRDGEAVARFGPQVTPEEIRVELPTYL